MDSGCHKLSENTWFVWSKRSYNGDGGWVSRLWTTDNRRTECEDRAGIVDTEFAKIKGGRDLNLIIKNYLTNFV